MNNKELEQQINREHDEIRFRIWLRILGNDQALTKVGQNAHLLHADQQIQHLVHDVVHNPVFAAIDGIYQKEAEIDPYYDADTQKLDDRMKTFAEQTYTAQVWVRALKNLQIVETVKCQA